MQKLGLEPKTQILFLLTLKSNLVNKPKKRCVFVFSFDFHTEEICPGGTEGDIWSCFFKMVVRLKVNMMRSLIGKNLFCLILKLRTIIISKYLIPAQNVKIDFESMGCISSIKVVFFPTRRWRLGGWIRR